jgi:hypothetical protein
MGLAADVGTLQILPKLIIDHSRFRELVYTSRIFDTNEAQQIGLIELILKLISYLKIIFLLFLVEFLILMKLQLMLL